MTPGPIRSLHGVAASSGLVRGPFGVETSVDGVTWDAAMAPLTLDPGANRNLNSSIWGNGYNAFMWGYTRYPAATATTGWVRFQNMGTAAGQEQVEVYATYQLDSDRDITVTFNWTDGTGTHTDNHTFTGTGGTQTWNVATGANTYTNWVEMKVNPNTPPTITTQPTNQSVLLGNTATFTVVVPLALSLNRTIEPLVKMAGEPPNVQFAVLPMSQLPSTAPDQMSGAGLVSVKVPSEPVVAIV